MKIKKSLAEICIDTFLQHKRVFLFCLCLFALFIFAAMSDHASGISFAAALGTTGVPARNNNWRNGPQSGGRPAGVNLSIPGMRHLFTDAAIAQSMNMMQIPDSFSIVVASGAAGVPTRVYVLNQDLLNNVTDNGSGAGSITYVYTDGFAGRLVSSLLAQDRAGMGSPCFGIIIRMTVTATGAGNPSGLGISNPFFAFYNAFGNVTATNMNMTSNQTRMDQDTSLEVVPLAANLGRFQQFSFMMPVLNTATVTIYTTPNYTI